jgi:hypothetical protein
LHSKDARKLPVFAIFARNFFTKISMSKLCKEFCKKTGECLFCAEKLPEKNRDAAARQVGRGGTQN